MEARMGWEMRGDRIKRVHEAWMDGGEEDD